MNFISLFLAKAHAASIALPPSIDGLGGGTLQSKLQTGASVATSALVGVIFLILVLLSYKLLFSDGDDTQQDEARKGVLHLFVGVIVIASAIGIAQVFTSGGGDIVNDGIARQIITSITGFIDKMLYTGLSITVIYQALKMITSLDEGDIATAKKNMLFALIGIVIVKLAYAFGTGFNSLDDPTILAAEIGGVARFLATIFGFLSIIGIMIGSLFFVISVDESLKENGIKLIITCLVSLVVVIGAYAITTFFVT